MENNMTGDELFEEYIKRAKQVINITIGALGSYLNGEQFSDMTEDQKDAVFAYVVEAWGSLLPPPAEKLWWDQLSFLALDQHLKNIEQMKVKELTKETLEGIYSQLGWEFKDEAPVEER